MSELRLLVAHTGEGHIVETTVPNGARLVFDGEGGSGGATPMQHFLAALAACSLMDVAHVLRKKRLAFSDLRAEAIGERPDEGHPKPFTSMKLVFRVAGDVPAKDFDAACRLAMEKYCNVGATLRLAVAPAFEAVVDPPRPDPAALAP